MMHQSAQDALEADPQVIVLVPHRGTCRVHGRATTAVLNRAGVTRRMWCHLERCWAFPVRDMPAVIARAEKDRRSVLIEDGWA